MKTFNKQSLPDIINYRGEVYYFNPAISGAKNANNTDLKHISTELKKEGRKAVLVKVLSKELKGKLDLHHKPYQPTEWIFTTNPKPAQ